MVTRMPITKITDTGKMDGKFIAYMYTAPGVIGVVPETRNDLLPRPTQVKIEVDTRFKGIFYMRGSEGRVFCKSCFSSFRYRQAVLHDNDVVTCERCGEKLRIEVERD